MTVVSKLATSLGRRDEVPNQELAQQIAASGDKAAVGELVENLAAKNKGIRNDCIKVLYEIGYPRPDLIAPHLDAFMALLTSKDNRLQWGGMAAVNCIASVRPDAVFRDLPAIIRAADDGSVITRDNAVRILIGLLSHARYANEAFAQLIRQMTTCPMNQFAMYAEESVDAIPAARRDEFAHALSSRIEEIPRESMRKRVEMVIRRLAKA